MSKLNAFSKVGAVVFLPLVLFGNASAQDGFDELNALESLKALLETNIATNTRPQDPDLAPGLVLVITREQMERSGAQTVADALKLIPGVTYQGLFTSPIVRGVGGAGSTASGKIKFQLNGRQFNEAATATDAGLLELRIDSVERIDVIRGPGSSVHGEYALSAVIDVITREDKHATVGFGSGKSRYVAASLNAASNHDEPIELRLVAGFDEQKGQQVTAGIDGAALLSQFLNLPNTGNAPGPVYDPRDNKHFILTLAQNGYALDVQFLDHYRGPYFGVFEMLSDNTDDALLGEQNVVVAVSADYDLGARFDARIDASWSVFSREFNEYQGYPKGFLGIYPDGSTSFTKEKLETSKVEGQLNWYQGENAVTAAGLSYADIHAGEASLRANFDLLNTLPGLGLPGPSLTFNEYPIGYEGRNRYISSAFIQQELKLFDKLNLTAGVHYDRYSDVEENWSPRFAIVWSFNDHHILKGSFAEAFRAPTFVEKYNTTSLLTGATNIRPEHVVSHELIYIYRDRGHRVEISAFDSEYRDVISALSLGGNSASSAFSNVGSFDTQGIEVSVSIDLTQDLTIGGFISYQNAEDQLTGASFPGTSDWINALNFNYQLSDQLSVSANYEIIGDRSREVFDDRNNLDGYDSLNVSVRYDRMWKNVSAQLDIVNAFDETIIQPSLVNTYPDDYPRAGRGLFLRLTNQF